MVPYVATLPKSDKTGLKAEKNRNGQSEKKPDWMGHRIQTEPDRNFRLGRFPRGRVDLNFRLRRFPRGKVAAPAGFSRQRHPASRAGRSRFPFSGSKLVRTPRPLGRLLRRFLWAWGLLRCCFLRLGMVPSFSRPQALPLPGNESGSAEVHRPWGRKRVGFCGGSLGNGRKPCLFFSV